MVRLPHTQFIPPWPWGGGAPTCVLRIAIFVIDRGEDLNLEAENEYVDLTTVQTETHILRIHGHTLRLPGTHIITTVIIDRH
jgi:hypothetical protein